MKSFKLIVLILFLSATEGWCSFPCGEVIAKVTCTKNSKYSYALYLPSNYDTQRADPWPVLFAMGNWFGGNKKLLQQYVAGAEKNGWIVAMSIECQGKDPSHNNEAVLSVFEDVSSRFAVNPKRCYASGEVINCQMAVWLADDRRKSFQGLILLNGGTGDTNVNVPVYLICGGNHHNRWNAAKTIDRLGDKCVARFCEERSPRREKMLFDAMAQHNATYLAKKGSKEELATFSEMIFNEINTNIELDPPHSYELACLLSEIKKSPHGSKAKSIAGKLKRTPEVKLYLAALDDMEDFVDDNINVTRVQYMATYREDGVRDDAEELAEKYAATQLAFTFRALGKPDSVQQKRYAQ